MTFKTKRDRFFVFVWTCLILLLNFVMLFGLFIEPLDAAGTWTVLGLDALLSASMIWLAVDIGYTFKEDYLLVKGGPFRSRIAYRDITKITGKPRIWIGYRIIFSRDAIEVHYKTGVFGSVVISPVDTDRFIRELLSRNPGIRIER